MTNGWHHISSEDFTHVPKSASVLHSTVTASNLISIMMMMMMMMIIIIIIIISAPTVKSGKWSAVGSEWYNGKS